MESALEGTNIRTATLYPAAINTELLGGISHQASAESMQQLYARFGISPDRIASVVAFSICLKTLRSTNSLSDRSNSLGRQEAISFHSQT